MEPQVLWRSTPNHQAIAVFAGVRAADLSEVTPDDLRLRLQQVINTYSYGSHDSAMFMSNFGPLLNRTTYVTQAGTKKVFYCNQDWISAFFLSTFAMFFAAVTGTELNFKNNAPRF